MTDDTISRQAAIGALSDEITITGLSNVYVFKDYVQRVKRKLEQLPSAQPITFDGVTLYRCDPEKNASCKKTGCYVNGGPCFMTSKKEDRLMDAIKRGDGLRPIPGYESENGFRNWP